VSVPSPPPSSSPPAPLAEAQLRSRRFVGLLGGPPAAIAPLVSVDAAEEEEEEEEEEDEEEAADSDLSCPNAEKTLDWPRRYWRRFLACKFALQ